MSLNMFELLGGTVRRLSHVRRYAALRVARIENVAEHSFYVAFIAMMIARDLKLRGVPVDELYVISGALAHDLDESIAGDMPRPFTKAVPEFRERLDVANSRFVKGIGRELGLPVDESWEVQRDESLEGQIVALADLLEVAAYVGEEVRSGNGYFSGVAREVGDGLEKSRGDYDEALEPYILQARAWIDNLPTERIPGDGERLAKLMEEPK